MRKFACLLNETNCNEKLRLGRFFINFLTPTPTDLLSNLLCLPSLIMGSLFVWKRKIYEKEFFSAHLHCL